MLGRMCRRHSLHLRHAGGARGLQVAGGGEREHLRAGDAAEMRRQRHRHQQHQARQAGAEQGHRGEREQQARKGRDDVEADQDRRCGGPAQARRGDAQRSPDRQRQRDRAERRPRARCGRPRRAGPACRGRANRCPPRCRHDGDAKRSRTSRWSGSIGSSIGQNRAKRHHHRDQHQAEPPRTALPDHASCLARVEPDQQQVHRQIGQGEQAHHHQHAPCTTG